MAKGWRGIEHRTLPGAPLSTHQWVFRCEKAYCYYAICVHSYEEGLEHKLNHECPYQNGVTKLAGSVTVLIVEDMWAAADKALSAMQDDGLDREEFLVRRGIVRGMCEMLALWTPPHFTTSDEVGHELLRRSAELRTGNRPLTPGLYGRVFEAPIPRNIETLSRVSEDQRVVHVRLNKSGTVVSINDEGGFAVNFDDGSVGEFASVGEFTIGKPKPAAVKFSVDQTTIDAIRFGASFAAFTVDQLATTYKIPVTEVKRILDTAPSNG